MIVDLNDKPHQLHISISDRANDFDNVWIVTKCARCVLRVTKCSHSETMIRIAMGCPPVGREAVCFLTVVTN